MVGGYDEQMPWTGLEEWIFGCTLLGTVLASLHLRKIGFDYRVRRDSMAVKTCPHLAELANYALGKPEASYYKLLREKDEEVENLRARTRSTKGSYSYRQEADYLLQTPIAETVALFLLRRCLYLRHRCQKEKILVLVPFGW